MPETQSQPKSIPGEIAQWPMLKLRYQTDSDAVAKLLPPGIEPGDNPNVNITIYNLPVLEEPEYGVIVTVDAKYNGQDGEYALAYGIDQEGAINISVQMNGQPKYLCKVDYYRHGDKDTARCHHQGYTFISFTGTVGEEDNYSVDPERVEWWTKYSRGVGGAKGYDYPPHVVKANGKYGPGYRVKVDGKLTLTESPWDPVATLLPIKSDVTSHLWWPEYKSWEVTKQGPLDPEAFWDYVDTIGGSRWPGHYGAPKYE